MNAVPSVRSLILFLLALALLAGSAPAGALPPTLDLGPIAGLTTDWHPAPAATSVPLGAILQLRVPMPVGGSVLWQGASEVSRTGGWSVAECPMDSAGQHLVQVQVTDAGGRTSRAKSLLTAEVLPLSGVRVVGLQGSVQPVALDPKNLNASTWIQYRKSSIAALRSLGPDRYSTSVLRKVTVAAVTDPPGFAPLTEWSVPAGTHAWSLSGAAIDVEFAAPGTYRVQAGAGAAARTVDFEVYRAKITSHLSTRDIINEGEATTLTAVTDPPGHESEITWLASTQFGSSDPVVGEGPTFTVRFDHTRIKGTEWLGVRADNSAFNQDRHGLAPVSSLPQDFVARIEGSSLTRAYLPIFQSNGWTLDYSRGIEIFSGDLPAGARLGLVPLVDSLGFGRAGYSFTFDAAMGVEAGDVLTLAGTRTLRISLPPSSGPVAVPGASLAQAGSAFFDLSYNAKGALIACNGNCPTSLASFRQNDCAYWGCVKDGISAGVGSLGPITAACIKACESGGLGAAGCLGCLGGGAVIAAAAWWACYWSG